MLKKIYAIFALLIVLTVQIFASGFSIYEQGAKSTALAGAFIATADDPSAVFYNPAGLTSVDGLQLILGTTVINTTFAFSGPNEIDSKQYTKAEEVRFFPSHLYLSYKYNDRIAMGFGFFSPFGLASTWGSDADPWVGRQLSTHTELTTFFYNPVIAIKAFDNLSLAAGFSLVQGNVLMEKSVLFTPRNVFGESALEADATGFGFNLGLQYKPFKRMTVGINYRSAVDLDFDGTATFKFPDTLSNVVTQEIGALFPTSTGGSSSLTLPYQFAVGLAYRFVENLSVEINYLKIGWSSYDKLMVTFDDPVAGQTQTETVKNYEDSYSLRFGLQYQVDEALALRVGYSWDEYTVPAEYLEPSLPEGNRHNYSIGLGYKIAGFNIDGFYHVLLQDDRSSTLEGFSGEYSGLATLYGFTLGYAF